MPDCSRLGLQFEVHWEQRRVFVRTALQLPSSACFHANSLSDAAPRPRLPLYIRASLLLPLTLHGCVFSSRGLWCVHVRVCVKSNKGSMCRWYVVHPFKSDVPWPWTPHTTAANRNTSLISTVPSTQQGFVVMACVFISCLLRCCGASFTWCGPVTLKNHWQNSCDCDSTGANCN